jgi:hypothetical protein
MKIEDDPLMSISDFAQRSGVNASALRFYESLGLIESVRSSGGRRRYHRSGLRRIAYIVFAQRVGSRWRRSPRSWRGCRRGMCPRAATGRRCRASGSSGWTSASTSCSACATA